MIAHQTGELLRKCGAKSFETTFLFTDHAPTADLPLSDMNADAFACVLDGARARNIKIRIELRRVG